MSLHPHLKPRSLVQGHLEGAEQALRSLARGGACIDHWSTELATRLPRGQRLLVAGNGGSAAEAQHLTAELVGRYDRERPAYSAIALHAETSTVTALGNDYGFDEVFARQVRAHGRPGDILLLLSTSGRSPNLLKAAATAHERDITTWALTGPAPNPLTLAVDDHLAIDASSPHVQECHLVAIHALCRVFDATVGRRGASSRRS